MTDQSIARIQRISKRLRVLLAALMFLVPSLDALFWFSFNHLSDGFLAGLPVQANDKLSAVFVALGFLVSLIPVSVALYGLATLSRLFHLYENAVFFTCDTVKLFRQLGYVMIAWVIANMLFVSLISVVITHGDPAGSPTMAVSIDVSDVSALIMGAIVVLISRVMDEGRKLEDEQMHTV